MRTESPNDKLNVNLLGVELYNCKVVYIYAVYNIVY